MAENVFLDLETYSDNSIKYGVRKYVDTDNFEILLLSYAIGDGEVVLIDMTKPGNEEAIERVKAMLVDKHYNKRAFNANFEMTCLERVWPGIVKPEQWFCDEALSTYNSLPPSLAGVGVALGLPQDKRKDMRGKALIRYFCQPCKATKTNGGRTRNLPEHAPEDWDVFCEYNRQDVVTERAIYDALRSNQPTMAEHRVWLLDRQINNRGVGIDTELAKEAIELSDEIKEEYTKELRDLTGLENPNSVQQLKGWLAENGCKMASIGKAALQEKLESPYLYPKVRRAIELRLLLGKSSVKKYQAMLETITKDGRAHNLFQFYGASHTGRWAGRNIQLQNLPRNYISGSDLSFSRQIIKSGDADMLKSWTDTPIDTISQVIRTALIPADGHRFIVADFSAIEARVIAWVSGEKWRQEAFAKGEDIYCASASQMFHCNVVKHGENGHLRQKGKIAELALGYGGGVGALKAMDTSHSIDESEMQDIVDKWRQASPSIPKLWQNLEQGFKRILRMHDSGSKKLAYRQLKILTPIEGIYYSIDYDGNVSLHLPSGRVIVYRGAHLGENRFGNKNSIIYEGALQSTRDWGEIETYGGKITENLVQAIARDCLAAAMIRLEEAGYPIVAHIHDEVVIDMTKGKGSLEDAIAIMTKNEPWNEGLIMNADGFEGLYYMKD